jgi:hypothetical protein
VFSQFDLFAFHEHMLKNTPLIRKLARLGACLLLLGLGGCSTLVHPPIAGGTPNTLASKPLTLWQPEDQLKWEAVKLPGKVITRYGLTTLNAHSALQANADSSASMLRKTLRIEPDQLNALSFAWQVPQLLAEADMAARDHDDSPVRLVLAFEGDRNQFSPKNAMLSELTHALTGQPMPYATLMYVWCNKRPVGTVIENPRTDRIRKIVVESGTARLHQWLSYERNIKADYEKAFGEAPGALIGIGLMTDSDNTRSKALAWYGPIELK